LTLCCEFYYCATGRDAGFDPEFSTTLDDPCRIGIKNAADLLSLEAADRGIIPTHWQRNAFSQLFW